MAYLLYVQRKIPNINIVNFFYEIKFDIYRIEKKMFYFGEHK